MRRKAYDRAMLEDSPMKVETHREYWKRCGIIQGYEPKVKKNPLLRARQERTMRVGRMEKDHCYDKPIGGKSQWKLTK